MKNFIVITTINKPTEGIAQIADLCSREWSILVVGDQRTPKGWGLKNVTFLSVEMQKDLFGELADLVPYNHYCRKIFGYLYAISQGAECILETDDDTIPYSNFGCNVSPIATGRVVKKNGWVNVYGYFTQDLIWPRGLPLEEIYSKGELVSDEAEGYFPIQQYLIDEDPDVDAVYRLVFKKQVFFEPASRSVILEKGTWAPFNSQNTLFFKEAFALLYLPCYVSPRITDIWRSLVAQISLWVHNYRIIFHTSDAKQVRNRHDLKKDFELETNCYLQNKRISEEFTRLALKLNEKKTKSLGATSQIFWNHLLRMDLIPREESFILEKWFSYF
jgi:hypothetical protein